MICFKCGKIHNEKFANGICRSCYRYFRDGGTENELPEKGVVTYDANGCVICHICGRAYKRLGSHLRESHQMLIPDYKEQFGLCANAKTTEKEYSKSMSDLAYKNNMPEQLKITGFNTRIKKGEKDKRLGKKTRLQETLNKRGRKREIEEEKAKANEKACCLTCKHLMFSDFYGECSKAYKGIVNPDDSCEHWKKNER